MASNPLPFDLPEPLLQQLEAIVRATGKSESEVIQQALSEYWSRERPDAEAPADSWYDVAVRAGFLGCDEGAPADLSVNTAHMEGFGRE